MRHREVALGGKSLRFPFKTDGTISLTKGGIILGNLSKGRFLGVKNSKPLGGGGETRWANWGGFVPSLLPTFT